VKPNVNECLSLSYIYIYNNNNNNNNSNNKKWLHARSLLGMKDPLILNQSTWSKILESNSIPLPSLSFAFDLSNKIKGN
jgi:hypothetical protein